MRSHCTFLIILCTLSAPCKMYAQNIQSLYRNAVQLPEKLSGVEPSFLVHPHWIEDTDKFWFLKKMEKGTSEFLIVDPSISSIKPLFNKYKIASALHNYLHVHVSPDKLPIENISFQTNTPHTILIQIYGETMFYDIVSNHLQLAPENEQIGFAPGLNPEDAPAASLPGGRRTKLTFINRSKDTMTLLWIDTDGIPHDYHHLKPGESWIQNTYSGHLWRVLSNGDKPVVAFIAENHSAVAIIDGRTPPRNKKNEKKVGVSPDGKMQVVFHGYNVYLKYINNDTERAFTHDGSAENYYGGSVYWSPNSLYFVLMRTIPAQKHIVYEVDSSPSHQEQPELHAFDYLKPGDRIEHPRPYLFNVTSENGAAIPDSLFPNPWDISDLRWNSDSRRFLFCTMQRGFQIDRLISINPHKDSARVVINEKSATFIDWTNKVYIRYLSKTHEAIWMSERDGWNHLYLYDTNTGRVEKQITRGHWVVRKVIKVDPKVRQIWFTAGGIVPGQNPYYIQYARINFDGSGLTLLSHGNGTHYVTFSPSGRYLVDSYSRVDLPPVTNLCDSEGKILIHLEKGDDSALTKIGWKPPERFVAKGRDGKTNIYGLIWFPFHLQSGRKAPVIEDIYAGPQGAYVPESFHVFYDQQQLAELGFIVVQIDGMGTNFRSKAFQDACWHHLDDGGFPDRILWIKAAAMKYHSMDVSRVGIYGTSAGGQNALDAVLLHGDFYKAAVADSGCYDNRMDKIWWNEQWMGWPVGPQYAENSGVTLAHKLTGKLLLMWGELDTNVDPASSLQVVNALIKANKSFEMLEVPGAGHGVLSTPYARRKMWDFFLRYLLGRDIPNWNSN